MQKPRDWLEGMKHSSTAQTMRHLRVEVMELCEGAGLYQIDLLNGSKERVSEAEYWARRRGQQKLDLANAAFAAAGQPPQQKKFETVKDTLRKQISSVLYRATSFEDFSDRLLQQYGIAVKESRGQLSYLPAGRTKFIRAKHLGDKFNKAAVLATLQANVERKPKAQFKQDTIGKLIDIQAKLAEGKSMGYARWAKRYNLKEMSKTLIFLQENKIGSIEEMQERIDAATARYHELGDSIKAAETRMAEIAVLRTHIVNYARTRPVYDAYRKAGYSKSFLDTHREEITLHKAAKTAFDEAGLKKLPKAKDLSIEYAELLKKKKEAYPDYRKARNEMQELVRARKNVERFFAEEKDIIEKAQNR